MTIQLLIRTTQGLINDIEYLKFFIVLANELFNNTKYLDNLLKTDFKENPMWGFTMMRVFNELSIKEKTNIIRLKESKNLECFDECICVNYSYRTNDYLLANKKLNKIYYDKNGNLYNYDLILKNYNLLWGINLSWVPDYVFSTLLNISKNKINNKNTTSDIFQVKELMVVKYKKPMLKKIKSTLSNIYCKIKGVDNNAAPNK